LLQQRYGDVLSGNPDHRSFATQIRNGVELRICYQRVRVAARRFRFHGDEKNILMCDLENLLVDSIRAH
jgi:hypothetical protein